MSGTAAGGQKTSAKILARDPDHYKKIGAKGGRNGKTGGFAANPELAREAGRLGGLKSRRGPAKRYNDDTLCSETDQVNSKT